MTKALNFIFARNYFTYVIIGLSLAVIICGYFFRNSILDFMHDVVQATLDITGFAIVFPVVWVCVLWYVLSRKEFNFTNIRYLISLVLSPIWIVGFLGLISTQLQGNYFYGDFHVISLGGALGLQISGGSLLFGIIRLSALFLILISIAYPRVVLTIGFGIWKLALMIYVGTALLFNKIFKRSVLKPKPSSEIYRSGDEFVTEETQGDFLQPGFENQIHDEEAVLLSDNELAEDSNLGGMSDNAFTKGFEKRRI